MVIGDQKKMERNINNKAIVYNLGFIQTGNIYCSIQWNNIIPITAGNYLIYGGNTNTFITTNEVFNGSILGKQNAINILDMSLTTQHTELQYDITGNEGKVTVQYRTARMTSTPSNSNMSLTTQHDATKVLYRIAGMSTAPYFSTVHPATQKFIANNISYFIGSKEEVENIKCVNNARIVLDTQGSKSSDKPDKIKLKNCKQVIVSANTEVTGRSSQPNFYIRPGIGIYKISVVTNQGKLIFPDTVLNKLHDITYSPKENVLSIDINLNQGANAAQHASHSVLKVVNYLNTAQNMANFELIDKNGHVIEPMMPSDEESKSITITSFSLKAEIDFKNTDPVTK